MTLREKHDALNTYYKEFQEVKGDRHLVFNMNEKPVSRWDYLPKYGYGVPTFSTLSEIHKYSPIIEVGSGNGYWAYLLREIFGTDIIPTDACPPKLMMNGYFNKYSKKDDQKYGFDMVPYKQFVDDIIFTTFPLIRMVAKTHTLFMSWPSYQASFAYRFAQCYFGVGGKRLIYIGEDRYGCCAEQKFFDYVEDNLIEVETDVYHARWDSMYDSFHIYEKNSFNKEKHFP